MSVARWVSWRRAGFIKTKTVFYPKSMLGSVEGKIGKKIQCLPYITILSNENNNFVLCTYFAFCLTAFTFSYKKLKYHFRSFFDLNEMCMNHKTVQFCVSVFYKCISYIAKLSASPSSNWAATGDMPSFSVRSAGRQADHPE